ncbi:MAG: cysteine synthase family protein [Candidatus Zixiibacteriota bacterium]
MKFPNRISELIGNTPLIELPFYDKQNPGPKILAKLEYLNPGGSVKDRLAKFIIEVALKDGRLKKGDTIIDNTSGNTGVAVAMLAAAYDLKAVFTTPEKTSQEKVDLIRALGAEVIRTPTEAAWDDPRSCYQLARSLALEKGYFLFNQYDNPDNIRAHYHSTGPEIWKQTEGRITHFIGGIGTGGTVSGIGQYLKEQNSNVKIIAVDPTGSMFADYIKTGKVHESQTYLVEGIGSDKVTKALDPNVIDEVISVNDEQSFSTARMITKRFGVLAGGSSGTAVYAALNIAKDLTPNDLIVVIFADSAIRYLSKCFSDEWMISHGFTIEETTVK